MKAVVLERVNQLSLRDIDLPLQVGASDVKIDIDTVGICGSDIHYYKHGAIGPFVVKEPMVLGHEASGTITEVGSNVSTLKVGDRVCMEPGIPTLGSRASMQGLYNVDPSVVFWATPPVHGCLTRSVVHPARFTFRLPDNVSFAEGAMIEPFAVGMQASVKAAIRPGDIAVVVGAGPIGMMTALAALASGCGRAILSDLFDEKLKVAGTFDGITPVNIRNEDLSAVVSDVTAWGADIVFETSGNPAAFKGLFGLVRPGGCVVLIGMPPAPVAFDVVAAQAKEVRIETVFRYANVFDRALNLIAAGKVDLKRLITKTFPFEESIQAFERAAQGLPGDIKLQIQLRP